MTLSLIDFFPKDLAFLQEYAITVEQQFRCTTEV